MNSVHIDYVIHSDLIINYLIFYQTWHVTFYCHDLSQAGILTIVAHIYIGVLLVDQWIPAVDNFERCVLYCKNAVLKRTPPPYIDVERDVSKLILTLILFALYLIVSLFLILYLRSDIFILTVHSGSVG